MTIYFFLLIILLLPLFLSSSVKAKNENVFIVYFYILNILTLWILYGLRDYTVGTDTKAYYYNFTHIDSSLFRGLEYGWSFLNNLVLYISGEFTFFLFLVGGIQLFFLSVALFKGSSNILLSLLLYYTFFFYLNSYIIARQIISCSIVLCAFVALNNSIRFTYLRYLLWVFLASLFHSSAFLLLLFPWFKHLKLPILISVSLLFLSFFFGYLVLPLVTQIISFNDTYSMYLSELDIESNKLSLNLIAQNGIVLFLSIFQKNKNCYFYFFLLGVVLLNLFVFSIILTRIALIFTISIVLLVPNLKLKRNYIFYLGDKISFSFETLVKLGITIYSIIALIIMVIDNVSMVCPYKFVF